MVINEQKGILSINFNTIQIENSTSYDIWIVAQSWGMKQIKKKLVLNVTVPEPNDPPNFINEPQPIVLRVDEGSSKTTLKYFSINGDET